MGVGHRYLRPPWAAGGSAGRFHRHAEGSRWTHDVLVVDRHRSSPALGRLWRFPPWSPRNEG